MNIVILDDYQDAVRKLDCAHLLDKHNAKVFTNSVKGIGQLAVRLRDAEVIVLIRQRTELSAALLQRLPKLRLVVQTGPIGPHVDVAACTRLGIAVAQGTSHYIAAAELTWALIMAASRRLPQYINNLKHGAWQQSGLKAHGMPVNFSLGTTLRGKTLGIWGYGQVGSLVAQYGRAFGMRVQVWGSASTLSKALADGFETCPNAEALFQQADVLTLHLRLTPETHHIVTAHLLALMKPTALLVNTARAELIQEHALITALNRGRPGLAAIDVFESEPPLAGQPLLRLENVVCTPHIGFVEKETYEHYFTEAFTHILQFLEGHTQGLINPEAMHVLRK
jgi:D-3-phosphoglycerate dehydrogenase